MASRQYIRQAAAEQRKRELVELVRGIETQPLKMWKNDRDFEEGPGYMDGQLSPAADYSLLSTFSWDPDEAVPVMVVPGQPRTLHQWQGGLLEPDSADDVVPLLDENRERLPMAPIEPMLRSVDVCARMNGKEPPDFNLFDIVTCRKVSCHSLILLRSSVHVLMFIF